MGIMAKEYLPPKWVGAAIATYNSIRTSLEEAGWFFSKEDSEAATYWWLHKDHPGQFSMPAAFRQLVVDQVEDARELP